MLYVNFDLETTGQRADHAAILSLGAVAIDSERMLAHDWNWDRDRHELSYNITVPENRVWEDDYKAWWDEQPKEIFEANRINPHSPWWVMNVFLDWMDSVRLSLKDQQVAFVGNPIAYDLPILRSYMLDYAKERWTTLGNDFKATLGGVDLPTLAMTVLDAEQRGPIRSYADSRRSKWDARWTPPNLQLTHIAIDDARLQAYAFVQMMRDLNEVRSRRPY